MFIGLIIFYQPPAKFMLREVVEAIFAVLFDDQDRIGSGLLAFGMVDQWKCKDSGIYFSIRIYFSVRTQKSTAWLYIAFIGLFIFWRGPRWGPDSVHPASKGQNLAFIFLCSIFKR